jgi:8-oxo-dGTP pyrophosphatase MutT (NUDIX family)
MKPWRVLESRTVVDRRWLKVHEQRIGLPHGGEIDEYHLLETPSWVAALALTDEGDVVLVDQYRHGAARVSRELPAGVIDEGESPERAAKRELLEETGYASERWSPLIELATEPGRNTTRAHFWIALGAHRVAEQNTEPSEHIAIAIVPTHELLAQITAGTIVHGVHVAAILLAAQRGLLKLA